MPTTIDGFKRHPLYTLHRHAKSDLDNSKKAVNPANKNAVAGVFKNEKVLWVARASCSSVCGET
jgi:hypothetical protein